MSTMKTNIAKREKSLMAGKSYRQSYGDCCIGYCDFFYKCGDTGR